MLEDFSFKKIKPTEARFEINCLFYYNMMRLSL